MVPLKPVPCREGIRIGLNDDLLLAERTESALRLTDPGLSSTLQDKVAGRCHYLTTRIGPPDCHSLVFLAVHDNTALLMISTEV